MSIDGAAAAAMPPSEARARDIIPPPPRPPPGAPRVIEPKRAAGAVSGRDAVPSALDVYRSALQRAGNHSITIASIGETTNLQDLLRSERELVRAKVKRVVYMDGDFNFGCADGSYGPNDECWTSAKYSCSGPRSARLWMVIALMAA